MKERTAGRVSFTENNVVGIIFRFYNWPISTHEINIG